MTTWRDSRSNETQHEAGGFVKGVAIALVTENKDEQGLCRVKVKYPWHESSISYWARIATPMAGKDRGLVVIPEIGDEVLVAFEREDMRFPYILGALWNGQQRPPRNNANGKNDERIFQSRKKHYLLFEDGTKGRVELKHEKGRTIVLDDDGYSIQDERGNIVKVDTNSGAMTIEAKGALKIKAASITIEATSKLDAKAGSLLTLQGNPIHIN